MDSYDNSQTSSARVNQKDQLLKQVDEEQNEIEETPQKQEYTNDQEIPNTSPRINLNSKNEEQEQEDEEEFEDQNSNNYSSNQSSISKQNDAQSHSNPQKQQNIDYILEKMNQNALEAKEASKRDYHQQVSIIVQGANGKIQQQMSLDVNHRGSMRNHSFKKNPSPKNSKRYIGYSQLSIQMSQFMPQQMQRRPTSKFINQASETLIQENAKHNILTNRVSFLQGDNVSFTERETDIEQSYDLLNSPNTQQKITNINRNSGIVQIHESKIDNSSVTDKFNNFIAQNSFTKKQIELQLIEQQKKQQEQLEQEEQKLQEKIKKSNYNIIEQSQQFSMVSLLYLLLNEKRSLIFLILYIFIEFQYVGFYLNTFYNNDTALQENQCFYNSKDQICESKFFMGDFYQKSQTFTFQQLLYINQSDKLIYSTIQSDETFDAILFISHLIIQLCLLGTIIDYIISYSVHKGQFNSGRFMHYILEHVQNLRVRYAVQLVRIIIIVASILLIISNLFFVYKSEYGYFSTEMLLIIITINFIIKQNFSNSQKRKFTNYNLLNHHFQNTTLKIIFPIPYLIHPTISYFFNKMECVLHQETLQKNKIMPRNKKTFNLESFIKNYQSNQKQYKIVNCILNQTPFEEQSLSQENLININNIKQDKSHQLNSGFQPQKNSKISKQKNSSQRSAQLTSSEKETLQKIKLQNKKDYEQQIKTEKFNTNHNLQQNNSPDTNSQKVNNQLNPSNSNNQENNPSNEVDQLIIQQDNQIKIRIEKFKNNNDTSPKENSQFLIKLKCILYLTFTEYRNIIMLGFISYINYHNLIFQSIILEQNSDLGCVNLNQQNCGSMKVLQQKDYYICLQEFVHKLIWFQEGDSFCQRNGILGQDNSKNDPENIYYELYNIQTLKIVMLFNSLQIILVVIIIIIFVKKQLNKPIKGINTGEFIKNVCNSYHDQQFKNIIKIFLALYVFFHFTCLVIILTISGQVLEIALSFYLTVSLLHAQFQKYIICQNTESQVFKNTFFRISFWQYLSKNSYQLFNYFETNIPNTNLEKIQQNQNQLQQKPSLDSLIIYTPQLEQLQNFFILK